LLTAKNCKIFSNTVDNHSHSWYSINGLNENDFHYEVMIVSITDLKLGEKAYIHSINGDNKLMKRLMALGCTEGTEVCLKNCAPFGDPLVINLRGCDFCIRKKDAKNISIKDNL
jgi:ferrous iron transport protein A